MNDKGKVEVMARKRTIGIYIDTFCYDSDIELRKDNTTYQHIASFPVRCGCTTSRSCRVIR